jgi:hypothetical protein
MQTAWLAVFAGTTLARNVPQLFSRDVALYSYLGCYQDSVGKRTLRYPSNRDYSTQTIETCTSWCSANKYSYCVSAATRKELHEYEFNHPSRALNMVPNAMATTACQMGLQQQSQTAQCHVPATRLRFAGMETGSVFTLAVLQILGPLRILVLMAGVSSRVIQMLVIRGR